MGFWHGVAATVALYLFCRWVAFLAPSGDPETGAGRLEFREGKERANVKRRGSNPPPPPPPKPRPPKNPPRSNNNYTPDSPHKSAIPTGEPGVIRRDVGLTDNTRDGGEE